MKQITLIFLLASYAYFAKAQVIDLSAQEWQLWLDKSAKYTNDKLYLPPYEVSDMEVKSPTCGWGNLANQKEVCLVNLPATIEQYAWGNNGNDHGICGDYTGVSWFSTFIDIPKDWKEKRIMLHFESARMRAEIYVNRRLAGYELINGECVVGCYADHRNEMYATLFVLPVGGGGG